MICATSSNSLPSVTLSSGSNSRNVLINSTRIFPFQRALVIVDQPIAMSMLFRPTHSSVSSHIACLTMSDKPRVESPSGPLHARNAREERRTHYPSGYQRNESGIGNRRGPTRPHLQLARRQHLGKVACRPFPPPQSQIGLSPSRSGVIPAAMKRSLCLLPVILLLGCKSWFYHEVPHKILIESDPPGARVELNQEYIGITPLEYTLLGGHNHAFSDNATRYVFRGNPVAPGQYVQEKSFHSGEHHDIIPKRIFFDLRLAPAGRGNSDVDLHIDLKAHESK